VAADGMAIGALSKRSGVNIETIRYYERIGVMPKPERTKGGYRNYVGDHLRRLIFIRRGRELGFSLDKLRELLRLVDGHSYTCAEVHELAVEHLTEIRDKISDLRRLQRVMTGMIAECSGDQIPECPVIDALFNARPLTERGRGKQKS
jgi:MerR family mercuric resistance operon transcriptional regulator